MKKIISVFLCLTLVFSLAVPAFAAPEEYPTIYVTGAQTNDIHNAEGKKIWEPEADLMGILKEALMPCLEELAFGAVIGDYREYAEKVNSYVAPVFEEVVLDKNGEASNGSHPAKHSSTVAVSKKTSNYGMWDYRFWYDWRLSPITTAEELKLYIDRVISTTNKDKVQLVGRCYGANVIQAYITLYKDHAIENVSDIAYYASSVDGIDFMSALFSGQVVLDDKAVTNFVEYYLEHEGIIEDPTLEAFVYTLVDLFEYADVLGLGTDALLSLFNEIKSDLIPVLLPSIIGTWPSYWAMVTSDLYDDAIEFVFGDCKDEYKGLIDKTDEYHEKVQSCVNETILELQSKGINFYFFSKYGYPEFPLHKDALLQSDSYTTVKRQSFGATSSNYGEVLSEKYISSLKDTKYLSPDYKIDASTCLIPERSWFVKNLHHNWFAELHDMTLEIMRYDMTVDNEKYPQYLTRLDDATLIPTVGTDTDYDKPEEGRFTVLIRFFTALFNMITKIFKGDFSFSFDF